MNLIALVDQNWGIAKGGKQICFLPDDLRRFRELTLGGTVIMGRKTYEAIGHPLKGRRNIVLSHDKSFTPDDCEVYGDIASMVEVLEATDYDQYTHVIGGESIYRQLLPYCNRAYITMVHDDLGADQFCPNLDVSSDWELISSTEEFGYQFRTYERRTKP